MSKENPFPFTQEELDAPVPQIPLDDPRLSAPVYVEVSTTGQSRRDESHYERSPWTIRDCVPSTWVNKHIHCFQEITFAGIDRFGNVGLGEKGTEGVTLYQWWDWTGIWRTYYRQTSWHRTFLYPEPDADDGELTFYAVENWLRFDTMTVEAKIAVLKRHVARHNWEIQRHQRDLADPNRDTCNRRISRDCLKRERQYLDQAVALLQSLGVPIDTEIVNAGRTGQLSLF
jgi:hypothetical protein